MRRHTSRLPAVTVLAMLLAAAPPAQGLPAAAGDAAAKLDPFLRRVVFGSTVHDGPFRRTIAAASSEALGALPGFLRVDRTAHPAAILVKARVEAEDGASWARLEEALAGLGVEVRARVGPIVALRAPVAALEAIAALPEIRWLKAAHAYRPQNDVSTGSAFVASRDANATFGTKGAGVIVAVIDTGIDWKKADFITAAGRTRILGIWDQTITDPLHPPPAGFAFGAYYGSADIDAALAAGGTLPTGDGYGHATHVAGTALGNGRQTGNGVPAGTFAGVAPEADLLIVRVFDDAGSFCADCDLTAAMQFVRDVGRARGAPWVANMSLGSDLGGHDGSDPDEQTIDALVGPGRAGTQVAIAAGNSAARGMHWQGALTAGGVFSNTFTVPSYTPTSGPDNDAVFFDLWYDGPDRATLEITSPTGRVAGAAWGVDSGIVCTPDGAIQIDATNTLDPANGDNEVFVSIGDSSACASPAAPKSGVWTMRILVQSVGATGGPFDVWDEAILGTVPYVTFQNSTVAGTVSVPGTARNVLTAGSYVGKTQWVNVAGTTTNASVSNAAGATSSFSGAGPSRDGRIKPDLSAPGEYVGSTLTGTVGATRGTAFTERDGQHGDIRGTSMATPHAAGVAALLLDLNPALDGAQVRAAIQKGAKVDPFTGAVPNNRYGSGKLNATGAEYQAAAMVTDLQAVSAGAFGGTDSPFVDSYNAYRGTIPGLSATAYGACLQSGLASPAFSDAALPAPGTAFFYLVTGVHAGIEGILGTDSAGRIRPNSSPCL